MTICWGLRKGRMGGDHLCNIGDCPYYVDKPFSKTLIE